MYALVWSGGDCSDEGLGLGTAAGDDCDPNVPVGMHRNRNKLNSHIVVISKLKVSRSNQLPNFSASRYVQYIRIY